MQHYANLYFGDDSKKDQAKQIRRPGLLISNRFAVKYNGRLG